jgi:hypothetical protein
MNRDRMRLLLTPLRNDRSMPLSTGTNLLTGWIFLFSSAYFIQL